MPSPYVIERAEKRRSNLLWALGGLVLVALAGAFFYYVAQFGPRSRPATVLVEMHQIHDAMNAYKEKRSQYPPCMAETDVASRKVHFMKHVQVAFANAKLGETPADFDKLRSNIQTPDAFGTGSQTYTFRAPDGSIVPLDLTTLDQAEALVFWLGGTPTPCKADGSPVAAIRNFGFNKDSDAPFKRDSEAQEEKDALIFRTDPYYDFHQERLVDNDNDGWLEYLPQAAKKGAYTAPFVYFDAETYNNSTTAAGVSPFDIVNLTGYPRDEELAAPMLAAQWGLAVPYAASFDPSGMQPIAWKQATSFQIIAPGNDGMYSKPVEDDLTGAMRLTVFPTGDTYLKSDGYATRTASYATEELDNQTNFNSSTLGESREIAQ